MRTRLTFPHAQRVFLAGASAGGFGAVFNRGQAQQAFGPLRVDLLDDSGPFMPPAIVPTTNLKYFRAAGSGHVLFVNPAITAGTTTLAQFLDKMVNDDVAWSSVQPPPQASNSRRTAP